MRVELAQHIVRQQYRRQPEALLKDPCLRNPQGHAQAALLTIGCILLRPADTQCELKIVTMRPLLRRAHDRIALATIVQHTTDRFNILTRSVDFKLQFRAFIGLRNIGIHRDQHLAQTLHPVLSLARHSHRMGRNLGLKSRQLRRTSTFFQQAVSLCDATMIITQRMVILWVNC